MIALYGLTLFVSAFLLFWIQPVVGKRLLPLFGGTPAVWTACLLFFQVVLLAGYSYAHFLVRLRRKSQAVVHLLLLAGSVGALYVFVHPFRSLLSGGSPVTAIAALLAVTIGLPFFVLSSTTPLLQSWFGHDRPGASPYPLYSLSNAGSLLAVAAYPVLIEPKLALGHQGWTWAAAYGVFAAGFAGCALAFRAANGPATAGPEPREELVPAARHRLLWIVLPACSSLALLAITNQLCLDVAAVPLLWVVPLGLYLLSFVLCFQHRRWYPRVFFGIVLAGSLAWSCDVLVEGVFAGLGTQIACCSLTLFAVCMVCHGELARIKPGVRHLTAYYGTIAAGSSLGAVFVAVAAPLLFKGYWEYHVALAAAATLYLVVLYMDRPTPTWKSGGLALAVLLCVLYAALITTLGTHLRLAATGSLEMVRNFYGVVRVFEENRGDPRFHGIALMHGRVRHGFQYQSPFRRTWPTAYYGPSSGIGIALRYHPLRAVQGWPLRIGVVGLGAGTLASYGQAGDYMRFYEINPDVVRLCRRYFSWLQTTAARVDVVPGDARMALEREVERGDVGQFDVLAVDAFSGDAVPVHLLTRECAAIYRAHLKADGILALHISSRYFDLAPVARGFALGQGCEALMISSGRNEAQGIEASDWVLVTSNPEFLNTAAVRKAARPWRTGDPAPRVWTDDYSDLFTLMRPAPTTAGVTAGAALQPRNIP